MPAPERPAHRSFGQYFVDSVLLAEHPDKSKKTPRFKWVHAASSGDFKGHHSGEFTLDAASFATMVRNLQADPAFKLGTVELEDGPIEAGASPVVQFDYEHASEMPATEGSIATKGAPAIGWVLDLQVRNGSAGPELWALADLGEQIRGQIDRSEYLKLSIAWAEDGLHWKTGKPIGPVLTSIAFTNHPFLRDLESIAASARARPPASHPAPGGVSNDPSSGAHDDNATKGRTMSDAPDTLRKRLTAKLKITTLAEDDAIVDAVEDAAEGSSQLGAILSLLGVEDGMSAMDMLPALRSAMEQLTAIQSELSGLMQADAVADDVLATEDVDAALATQGLGAGMKPALGADRARLVGIEVAKLSEGKAADFKPSVPDIRAARALGRKAFQVAYKIEPGTQHLTKTLVAAPNGVQVVAPTQPTLGIDPGTSKPVVNLSAYTGSTTSRVMQHLKATDQVFKAMHYDAQFDAVRTFKLNHQVT